MCIHSLLQRKCCLKAKGYKVISLRVRLCQTERVVFDPGQNQQEFSGHMGPHINAWHNLQSPGTSSLHNGNGLVC